MKIVRKVFSFSASWSWKLR